MSPQPGLWQVLTDSSLSISLFRVEWVQLVVALVGAAISAWRVWDSHLHLSDAKRPKLRDPERVALAQSMVYQAWCLLTAHVLLVLVGVVSVSYPPPGTGVLITPAVWSTIVYTRWLLVGVTIALTTKAMLDRFLRVYLHRVLTKQEAERRVRNMAIPHVDRRH